MKTALLICTGIAVFLATIVWVYHKKIIVQTYECIN